MTDTSRLLICMMGLPRSGKSTVARVLSRVHGAPIVNRDSVRLALHGERYLAPAEPMIRVLAKLMVEALFNAGHQIVIVDETNMKKSTRDYWRDVGWLTKFLFVQTSQSRCLARAAQTHDEAIRPVIRQMASYAQLLGKDEARYVVSSADVSAALKQAVSKGLKVNVTG